MAHTAAAHGLDLAHRIAASCARGCTLSCSAASGPPHAARAEGQPLEPPVSCPPTCAAVRRLRASIATDGAFEPRAPSPPGEKGEVPCCAARDGRLSALGAIVHAARDVSRAARPDARGCGSGLSCPKGRCTSWLEVHLLVPHQPLTVEGASHCGRSLSLWKVPHLPLALQPQRPVRSRARHGAEAEPATRYACKRLRGLARAESRPPFPGMLAAPTLRTRRWRPATGGMPCSDAHPELQRPDVRAGPARPSPREQEGAERGARVCAAHLDALPLVRTAAGGRAAGAHA